MSASTLESRTPAIEAAYHSCSEDARTRARNFWYGLRLLPPTRFRALCAVYSWMRRVDDLADAEDGPQETSLRESGLESFRARTRALFEGNLPDDAPSEEEHIWIAMHDVIGNHEIDADDFELMIDGQLADLEPRCVRDSAELNAYCDQVASTVGRICVRIWGAGSVEALRMASDRGVAFQITNILRDIREDFGRDRVYLPADALAARDLDVESLLAWKHPAQCTGLVQELANLARDAYERASDLDQLLEVECRPTSWAMTTIYRSLLEKIAHRPHLVAGTARIRLSSLRKAAIALRARRFAWYGLGERGGEVE